MCQNNHNIKYYFFWQSCAALIQLLVVALSDSYVFGTNRMILLDVLAARNHKFGRQSGADEDGYGYGASGYSSYWKNVESGGGYQDEEDIEGDDDYDDDDDEEEEEDDDDDEEEEEEDTPEVEDSLSNLSLGASGNT